MSGRTLVAGVGNIFCGDDGFGVALAERLVHEEDLDHVTIASFGLEIEQLACELLNGYDTLVLLDAQDRGDEPGTVAAVDLGAIGPERVPATAPARRDRPTLMDPEHIATSVARVGAHVPQCWLVTCQPVSVASHVGLSPNVAAAVPAAARVVHRLLTPTTHDPEEG